MCLVGATIGGGLDCAMAGESAVTADTASIVQADSCGTAARTVDPQLAELADNGGVGQTHLPLSTSPALDSGNIDVCETLDQRGVLRESGGFMLPIIGKDNRIAVVDLSGQCDVGAVEIN